MIASAHRFHFGGPLPKYIFKNPFFLIRYQKNDSLLKVGIVVSRRVSKKATQRNRIKRIMIEMLLSIQNKKNIPLNMVLYARSGVEQLSNQQIRGEVQKALEEIQIK